MTVPNSIASVVACFAARVLWQSDFRPTQGEREALVLFADALAEYGSAHPLANALLDSPETIPFNAPSPYLGGRVEIVEPA
jgi:hypothetical protein